EATAPQPVNLSQGKEVVAAALHPGPSTPVQHSIPAKSSPHILVFGSADRARQRSEPRRADAASWLVTPNSESHNQPTAPVSRSGGWHNPHNNSSPQQTAPGVPEQP